MTLRKYSIGTQTFEKLITENRVYVDKTELIYNLVQYSCVFLSRPRRFGKSLLCSTLKSYFEGRKDLFAGLAMEKLETEWVEYPVIHLDFSDDKSGNYANMNKTISDMLEVYEKKYDAPEVEEKTFYNIRFRNIVESAYEKTGKKVVIIIDEYDSLMLNVIDNDEKQNDVRTTMNNLFSPIKKLDPKLRFVFITGITKFSQMSIFSALNNLYDVSLNPEYEGICGITKEEMTTALKEDLETFATKNKITYEQAVKRFKERYDGYHFSTAKQDIFNPYSVFNAFDSNELKNFWFDTGTPTSLIKLINKFDIEMPEISHIRCRASDFSQPVEKVTDLTPFLFQSGYLSIKDYNPRREMFILGFPNKEVKSSFAESLNKYHYRISIKDTNYLLEAYQDLEDFGDIAGFMKYLEIYFRKFPFSLINKNEKHYHSVLYTILSSYGADVVANPESAKGRADLLLRFDDVNYVFELKLDGKTRAALDQIDDKDYIAVAMEPGKKIVKLAINFSASDRCILDWDVDDGFEF
ncbi:MAG: ATP-binding protein [Bacteroidales bacterium]|nr:ATP-binding protein [Bacteroidales bacterium]